MKIQAIPFAVALACTSSAVCAQTSSVETITVTGSKLPISLDKLAASVTVLNEQDIEAAGATQLIDLVRGMPGVSISQSGSPGALTELRLRGSETNHLLVLIDGVIVNDLSQGGLVDFAHQTSANIARIELFRGAQSALWGSGAVAGVLSITTKSDSSETPTTVLSAGVGNTDTVRTSVNTGFTAKHIQTSFYASHFNTAGDNVSRTGGERDGYKNTTAGAGLTYTINHRHSLSGNLRWVDYENEYDGTDYYVTGLPADANNVTNGEQLTSGLKWLYALPSGLYSSQVQLQYHKDDNDNLTDGLDTGGTSGERKQISWTHFINFDAAQLAVGSEWLRREFEQRGPVSYGDPNYRGDDSTSSLFAELSGLGTKSLSTQLSVRYDDNERFNKAWSYRAGARYYLTGNTSLFASISQAIKTPSFTELYGYYPATFLGNPNLKPEQSREFEVGVRSTLGQGVTADLSLYSTKLNDEILGFVYDLDSGMYTAQNASEESRREGVEASLQWATTTWQVTASYTYLDASEGDGNDKSVELRRPRHTGAVTYRHSLPVQGLSVYIKAAYTGERKDTFYPPWPASATTVDLSAYWLTSINVSYEMTKQWQFGLRIDNTFDESYEDIVGYRGEERRYLAHTSYRF